MIDSSVLIKYADLNPAGCLAAVGLLFKDWDESQHPRGPDGKFGSGGGTPEPKPGDPLHGMAAGSVVPSTVPAHHLLHGTSLEAAQKIVKEGLKASDGNKFGYGNGRPNSVYFTTSKDTAIAYGSSLDPDATRFAVVRFHVPDDQAGSVKFDATDAESFGAMGDWRIEQDIPPEWIDNVGIYDSNSLEWMGSLKLGKAVTPDLQELYTVHLLAPATIPVEHQALVTVDGMTTVGAQQGWWQVPIGGATGIYGDRLDITGLAVTPAGQDGDVNRDGNGGVLVLAKHCGVCPEDADYYGAPIAAASEMDWPDEKHVNGVEIVAMVPEGMDSHPALFKPEGEELETLNFRVGGHQYLREEAAYLLDRSLQAFLVPVAYVAEVNDERGAVIYYSEHAGKGYKDVSKYAGKWVELAAIFDWVSCQTDRHGGNYLTHPDDPDRPLLIDNGLGFPTEDHDYKSPFIAAMAGKQLSTDALHKLKKCCGDRPTWRDLADLLEVGAAAQAWKRACDLAKMGAIPEKADSLTGSLTSGSESIEKWDEADQPRGAGGKWVAGGGGDGDKANEQRAAAVAEQGGAGAGAGQTAPRLDPAKLKEMEAAAAADKQKAPAAKGGGKVGHKAVAKKPAVKKPKAPAKVKWNPETKKPAKARRAK